MGIFDSFKKERAKPDFTNVRSGSSTAPAPEPQADGDSSAVGSADVDTDAYYIVVEGDTLSAIARRQYGDANKWGRIFEANRDLIKDADLIHPGQHLRIP